MKRWIAGLVCLAALEGTAFADDLAKSFKAVLQATENRIAKAVAQKDLKYLGSIATGLQGHIASRHVEQGAVDGADEAGL